MPCRDYEDDNRGSYSNERIAELQAQNDRLARIACEMAQQLSYSSKQGLSKEAADWWNQHQIADAAEVVRKAKEKEHNKQVAIKAQKRRELIASMPKEQRDLLGLK